MPTCVIRVSVAKRPLIALTPGEPAGIGPDLVALLDGDWSAADCVCLCDPGLLRDRARQRGIDRSFPLYEPGRRGLSVLPVALERPVRAGVLDVHNADYVLHCLKRAARGCRDGEFDALVTGPVHKGLINDAGHAFSGHTEFLAAEAGVSDVVMMLTAGALRVALVTTHLPLARVPAAITHARVASAIAITAAALERDFAIATPRILVLGLNPHAGEDGHLGREEIEIIEPAIRAARARGLDVIGPVPADTAFVASRLTGIDAVLAMYHDQGLPVLKREGFGAAVNVTLGLPFIRTSVDHGTALERAGALPVDTGSLKAALALASTLVSARERT